MTNEDATAQICEDIKGLCNTFGRGKYHAIRVSCSIDATAVATGLFIHGPNNTLVGGALPYHSLCINPNGDDLREMIDSFDAIKGTRKKACEVILFTVVVQNAPKDISPMHQFVAQPQ